MTLPHEDLDHTLNSFDLEASWVSGKRRPKPLAIQADCVEVSRESGLHSSKGTFGASGRFGSRVVGPCQDSPNKREYYARNQMDKLPQEVGLSCTLGIGARPEIGVMGAPPPSVGPGSYDIVASACMRKSPLDGSEYCSTTMHHALPSKLTVSGTCSPGPHHSYDVRKPLDHDRPAYRLELLSHGTRHMSPEDTDGPGLRNNDLHHLSVARNSSCPNLHGTPDAKGSKRCLKTTFGTADRFKTAKQSCSPAGEMGYAHFKFPTSEDYLARSRSCTFGCGSKTDFSNPYRGHRSSVSPAMYSPSASATRQASALDGFASRCTSPVHAACRGDGTMRRRLTAGAERSSARPSAGAGGRPTPAQRDGTNADGSAKANAAGDGGEAPPAT